MAEYRSTNATRTRGRHRATNQPNRVLEFLRRIMAVGMNTDDI